ncbi:hypothetical protein CH306_05775 [Rhodococcus sp. 15-725-2-2b]|uniref:glycosyltransferase n=1 Tax=unclassified Rhodococcus (in: high G+C Gram-positive bacteria) TaxID=192944 RepID=UPI000B9C040A|nr:MULTISPECIES: glycosyltransferase [unclassified Rhodococcus (in: high G+C Gram-positive bacteria)]OZC70066.1 hypothetical protein CH277_07985 [Rhodococcus sp. 06-469-3-2]OZD40427.1 hypothetical protein CH264_26800 [Rhodococcus sp. 06-1477-1A]OZE75218.1 hypothetical protein CH306_05775 [Rhodococcus sp. 15-725-2-2b]
MKGLIVKRNASVDVIIVCFNSDPVLLKGCVDSVSSSYSESNIPGTVILIDNASDIPVEHTIDASGVRVYRMDSNVGFGRAVNHGVSISDADHVLLLNPDAAIKPDGIRRLSDVVKQQPRSLVGGWLQRDGKVQSDAYMQWDFSVTRLWSRGRFASTLMDSALDVVNVEKVCGGALFADRRLLAELGPFDPRFFLYGEDADLSRRAASLGVRLLVARHAPVEHISASSQKSYGSLVEQARADAAIRITSYHRNRVVSLLQRFELFIITLVGAVAGGASSSTRRARLDRLKQVRRWGLMSDAPPYSP